MKNNYGYRKCQKCGHQRSGDDDPNIAASTCPLCGVIYDKYESSADHKLSDKQKIYLIKKKAKKENGLNDYSEEKVEIEAYIADKKTDKSIKINTRVVVWVSDFFIGLSAISFIFCVIAVLIIIFSDFNAYFLAAIPVLLFQSAILAAFGYIVKLLCGIYLNTKN